MKIILSIVALGICSGLFIFSYVLNQRTPKPEGCVNLSENCEGCQITSCANHKKEN